MANGEGYITNFFLALLLFSLLWFLMMVFVVKWLLPFCDETNYIKMEMERSEGKEYRHWRKKLIRHYLRLIPFVGLFLGRREHKNRDK